MGTLEGGPCVISLFDLQAGCDYLEYMVPSVETEWP